MDYTALQKFLEDNGGLAQDPLPSTVQEDLYGEKKDVPVYILTTKNGSQITVKIAPPSGGGESTAETNTYTVVGSPKVVTRDSSAGTTATATNTSTSYRWDQTPDGGRRLHVVTKDHNGTVISDDEADPAVEARYVESEQRARNGGKTDKEIQDAGKKTYGPAYKNESGVWVRPWTDASGNKGAEEVPEGERPQEPKPTVVNTNTTDRYIVKSDGSQAPNPNYVEPEKKPTLVDLPGGGKGQLVPDPANPGQFKAVPIDGAQAIAPGGGPSLDDLTLQYGTIVDSLKGYNAKLQAAVRSGAMSQADMDKRWTEAKDVASVKINELNTLASNQRALYSDQSSNWRQQQATANTRMNAASTAMETGVKSADSLKGLDPSGTAGMANMFAPIALGAMAGKAYGGYASDTPPPLPVNLQNMLNMSFGPDGSIHITPPGVPATGAPGEGPPPVPASVTAAMPDAGVGAPPPSRGPLGDPAGVAAGAPPLAALVAADPSLQGFDPDVLQQAHAEIMAGA